jgi:hypothetical protein
VGTVTTAGSGTNISVSFSSPINGANFSVSLVTTGVSTGIGAGAGVSGCVFNVESQNANSFTFSCRRADTGARVTIPSGISFEYIAITNN